MTTKIDPNTVRIEPHPGKSESGYPIHRGRKLIIVGEEHYGEIHMHQHGGRGNSYTFQQIGGEEIGRYSKPGGGGHFHREHVDGDKIANWVRRGDEPAIKPVAERLHAKAVELIQSGRLISATAQAERVAEGNRKWQERQDKAKAAEAAKFDTKAREALRLHDLAVDDALVGRIVDAMRWAQTQ